MNGSDAAGPTGPPTLLLIAKEAVPGRVKTRLCPPCTPDEAAAIAAAATADTLDVLTATPARRRVVAATGALRPDGFEVLAQRGDGLAERLANAFADVAASDPAGAEAGPVVLVGMDTPQLTVRLLDQVLGSLTGADAVLGVAGDGGWWTLALRRTDDAEALRGVPMSTPQTCVATAEALRRHGAQVAYGPELTDVDTFGDALAVAGTVPDGRFAAAVRRVAVPQIGGLGHS